MIHLFRKIRHRLLEQNRLTRYLIYAFGEIVLVVIGILIALQINNWNENRKDAIEEKVVLKSLLENLQSAKAQSASLIFQEHTLKASLIRILEIDNEEKNVVNEIIPDSIFKSAVWDLQSDQPTFNAYNNLKYTNKLSLIRAKAVKDKFTELEFRLNQLNDILKDRLNVHQIRIDDILENDINFIPLVKSNVPELDITKESGNNYYELLKQKRIRNLLGMKLTFTQDVINNRVNLDKEIDALIILIEDELKEME